MDEATLDALQAAAEKDEEFLAETNAAWGRWVHENEGRLAEMSEEDADSWLAAAESWVLEPSPKGPAQEAALSRIRAWHVAHIRRVASSLRDIREQRAEEAGAVFVTFIRTAEQMHIAEPEGTTWLAHALAGLQLLDDYPEWEPPAEDDKLLLADLRDLRKTRGEQMAALVGELKHAPSAALDDRAVSRGASRARKVAREYAARLAKAPAANEEGG